MQYATLANRPVLHSRKRLCEGTVGTGHPLRRFRPVGCCNAGPSDTGEHAMHGITRHDAGWPETAVRSVAVGDHSNMIRISGGTFRMGSDKHYPEEGPVHCVTVDDFWIDRTPVTNRDFRKFVNATKYVTFAQIKPNAEDYPGALPHMLKAGSLVFTRPKHRVDTRDWSQWWNFKFGADWKRPYGPRSSISGLDDHPVVHVAYKDALAYAKWAGKDLPTEAEGEFAAGGGLDGAEFAWGDELTPGGKQMANTWQGSFPLENLKLDGYERTSPVTAFPPNGYGAYDMIGNVWEWTSDWYSPKHEAEADKACCIPINPRGGREDASYDRCLPE